MGSVFTLAILAGINKMSYANPSLVTYLISEKFVKWGEGFLRKHINARAQDK